MSMKWALSVRIHRWVLWWFYVGIACGAVALANIFFRDLTRTEEKVILGVGVLFWLLAPAPQRSACRPLNSKTRPNRRPIELS